MKKLLFAAVSLELGGIEKALVTLINYLAQQKENNENSKYKITLVLEKRQGLFLNDINKNVKIIEYSPNKNAFVPIRKLINLFKQLSYKKNYKNKFDFSCAYATYSLPASFIARTSSRNSALWVHSEYMTVLKNSKEEYKAFFNTLHINEFRKVIFVSESSKKTFIENFNKYKEKSETIHNLINYNEILEKSKEKVADVKKEEIFTFINVGRHTEEDKKLSRIIEAAKKLKQNNAEFRILLVGEGKDDENYKQKVRDYQLENEIMFLGKKKNPYPYYKIADCMLLTSEYEGFPVVYTEAMTLELPIITTNVSDSEKIINNKFGIVVEKNIDSIYNAMKKSIESEIKNREKFDYKFYNNSIIKELEKTINKKR